jgi:hypothetical protein
MTTIHSIRGDEMIEKLAGDRRRVAEDDYVEHVRQRRRLTRETRGAFVGGAVEYLSPNATALERGR